MNETNGAPDTCNLQEENTALKGRLEQLTACIQDAGGRIARLEGELSQCKLILAKQEIEAVLSKYDMEITATAPVINIQPKVVSYEPRKS